MIHHEINASLALVVRGLTPTHSTIMWEQSQNGELTWHHPEALVEPTAEPGVVRVMAVPHTAAPVVLDWVLARFALVLATVRAEEERDHPDR